MANYRCQPIKNKKIKEKQICVKENYLIFFFFFFTCFRVAELPFTSRSWGLNYLSDERAFLFCLMIYFSPLTTLCPFLKEDESYTRKLVFSLPSHKRNRNVLPRTRPQFTVPAESGRLGHIWPLGKSQWNSVMPVQRRKQQPTPVFLPGESQGRGSLVGCHQWGAAETNPLAC